MRHLRGTTAAVTGAAHGIGRALASCLAEEGCRLAIADVDGEGLEEAARGLEEGGTVVDRQVLDVADRAAVFAWADRLARELAPVRLVVNNAGVSLSGAVADTSEVDFAWVMAVNFWGVVHGSQAFLPHLEAAGGGCIVNVSSVFGLFGFPTHAAYSTSKCAVLGFTEALGSELEVAGSPVRALCAIPGGVRTGLVRSGRRAGRDVIGLTHEEVAAGFDRLARATPEEAAAGIVRGIKRGKGRILVGIDAHFLDYFQRLTPSALRRFIVRRARRARRLSP